MRNISDMSDSLSLHGHQHSNSSERKIDEVGIANGRRPPAGLPPLRPPVLASSSYSHPTSSPSPSALDFSGKRLPFAPQLQPGGGTEGSSGGGLLKTRGTAKGGPSLDGLERIVTDPGRWCAR
jgi:hypothetical protein